MAKKPSNVAALPTPERSNRVPLRVQEWAQAAKEPRVNPFRIPDPPPGVVPAKYAMDDANGALGWAANNYWASAVAEGTVFLGYPYLAELAQRAEYRQISETIATEMTRRWIKFTSKSESSDQDDRIKELEDALDHFGVRDAFRVACEQDGFFGRGHIYLAVDGDEGTELKKPIGNGRDRISRRKIAKGALKYIKPIEATWCYPNNYNANNPLLRTWYRPDIWFVMSQQVHRSRLLTLVGREVPDILKAAYMFGGLSMSQMAKPYIDNWLRTRQSVSDLAHNFSVMNLQTDLQTLLQGSGQELMERVALFNGARDNRGLMLTNKNTEDLKNVSVPLSGLSEIQAQAQEHMAAVSRIPLIKLLGIEPTGLNASTDGQIRTFYDSIAAYQERFFRPPLTTVIDFVQLSVFGEIDDDISFEFQPLWQLDDAGTAAVEKTKADIDEMYLSANILSGEEVRRRLAQDPKSLYAGIEPDDLPEIDELADGGGEEINDPMTNRVDKAGEGSAASVTSGV